MTDTLVEDVTASATISDTEMRVTYIEVTRSIGVGANQATVKGIVDDVGSIELDDTVDVQVEGERVFLGLLKEAKQNEEGIVEITAYDQLVGILNKQVRLNVIASRRVYTVLIDLLRESGYTVGNDLDTVIDNDVDDRVYMPEERDMITPGALLSDGFGSGNRGEPLSRALRQLADVMHAVVWVDRNNVLRIQPYPEHNRYEANYIIQVDGGSDASGTQQIIVEGGTPTGSLGAGASSIYSETNHRSVAERENEDGEIRTLQDQNVITQEGTDSLASMSAYRQGRQRTPGTITIVGNTSVDLFDVVEVPQNEETSPLAYGEYSVKQVQHVVGPQDGFKTTLTLSLTPEQQLENVEGKVEDTVAQFLDTVSAAEVIAGALGLTSGFE